MSTVYYWNFINMKYVTPRVQEAMEDIFIILNKKWNYEDIKTTNKMIQLFKKSEELLEETMSIKVSIDSSEKPEELLSEVNRMGGNSIWGGGCG